MVIYCSSAFQKSLNIGKEEIVDSSEIKEEELFCWHAHIKKVNGKILLFL
ncbi:hypothetical protein [Helcococcus kunzii]|nr:hypothetical protein [Helcococcus kunzii]MCT1796932.1 hypothetical protein [Helcococcus kunzii]MCT1988510.1 hypothetical protein [Helcococcus kunzii]